MESHGLSKSFATSSVCSGAKDVVKPLGIKSRLRSFPGITMMITGVACGYLYLKQRTRAESLETPNIKHLHKDLAVGISTMNSEPGKPIFNGSGVVFDRHGHIVTCAHVTKGSDCMLVYNNEKHCVAYKVGENEEEDIAVLKTTSSCFSPEKTFEEVSVKDRQKRWDIRYKHNNLAIGFCTKSRSLTKAEPLQPMKDSCLVMLTTPKRHFCLGRLGATPGYSGGGVFTANEKSLKPLGLYRFGCFLADKYGWFGAYIRHETAQKEANVLINKPK